MLEYQNQSQASGSFTSAGTPAAVRVNLGWTPSFVKFYCADTNAFVGEWYSSMADASFVKSLAGGTIQAEITTNGVTPNTATTSALQDGFTMGTACQVTTKVTHWVAFR